MNESAGSQPNQSTVIEVTGETFQRDVIDASHERPVVVDFWAEWCQPCRMLGPVLEQLAAEYEGRFLLAKVNVDQAQDVAGAFGVSSIPAVYGLYNGELRDNFVGVLPEQELRDWIDGLLPSPAEECISEAKALAATDAPAAEAKFREALQLDPRLPAAKIGLAQLLLDQGRLQESKKLLDELADRGFLKPEAETLQAELNLRLHGEEVGSVDACRAALAESPDDPRLQLKLAESLASAGQYEEALETALSLVENDRHGTGEEARQVMVDIFHSLGDDSELVSKYRRKLALALY